MNLGALEYNVAVNEEFTAICKPLLDALDLTHFIYINLLSNNQRLYLCNDLTWINMYIKEELHNDPKHENTAIVSTVKPECVYWGSYGKDRVFDAARSNNMSNGFIIYEGDEIYSFATANEKTNVIYSYIEQYEILKHFILYFKCKAHDLIKTDQQDKLIHSISHKSNSNPSYAVEKENILNNMPINKFHLDYKNVHAALSIRELECLVHAAHGKSGKQIAWVLGVAECTIETYMEHIKIKMGCHSKCEIIETFYQSNLKYLTPENIKFMLGAKNNEKNKNNPNKQIKH